MLSIVGWFLTTISTNNEVQYDGAPLKIAVLGDIPELQDERINFESITLEELSDNAEDIAINFNAVMITPTVFQAASDDKFVDIYKGLEIPIVFFDSAQTHKPFVYEGTTYESSFKSLKNGSHTTVYLYNPVNNREDAWFFYLEKQSDLGKLYSDVFKKIEEL